MKQDNLSKPDLEALHSVLRRAAERAERNRDEKLKKRLEEELAVIDLEMRGG